MTDKQIIIDGCIHLDEWKHCDICEKLIKTKDGANGKKREHLLTEEDLRCDFYPNCYFKQLTRKSQECEMWKNLTVDNGAVALKYQQQLDQLKVKCEELEKQLTDFMNGEYCANGCAKMQTQYKEYHTKLITDKKKAEQKLEKIRQVCAETKDVDIKDMYTAKLSGLYLKSRQILQIIDGEEQ